MLLKKKEHEKYCRNKNIHIPFKKYRRCRNERLKIKQKLNKTIRQIRSMYLITDEFVSFENIQLMIQTYDKHFFDPIDFLAVCPKCRAISEKKNHSFNYITDDSDFKFNENFKFHPKINLYTFLTEN